MNNYLVSCTLPDTFTLLIFTAVAASNEESIRKDLPDTIRNLNIKLSFVDARDDDNKVWWLGGRWNDARLLDDYKKRCKRF